MSAIIYLILFPPLIGSLIASSFILSKKNILAALAPIFAITISLLASLYALIYMGSSGILEANIANWIHVGSFNASFGFIVDGISIAMIITILIVSLLVHIYSIGYMAHDKAFNKFFCFLSAFVFSMLVLVISDNFLGLFIGWEGVGLCSYMLIGFWNTKDSANFAANEAFIMNRITDIGMMLGIFYIYIVFGSLNYGEVFSSLAIATKSDLLIISLLLFIGAMGKSAQFPFHTWLANAMEGPTPVSALIHAATMVTAGVYLVIRANPIYSLVEESGMLIAYIGTFVAFFAASMAIVNNDLKRIIAYSTLSQLGYMFVAAGMGYYVIALFHLITHAFFKSLLFLGAGNVMHSMDNELNIQKMGELYKPIKYSAILMTIASLSLSGVYPFAGFFSKDKILEAAFSEGMGIVWIILLFTALLTAFYSFRLLMLVFFTPKRHAKDVHEDSKIMIYPLLPLAILAIVAGFYEKRFSSYLSYYLDSNELNLNSILVLKLSILSLIVVVFGIASAIIIYKKNFRFIKESNFLYKLLSNQYYIPQIYDFVFIKMYKNIGLFFWKIIDIKILDSIVNLVAFGFIKSSSLIRKRNKGDLGDYLMLMVKGLFVLMLAFTLISIFVLAIS